MSKQTITKSAGAGLQPLKKLVVSAALVGAFALYSVMHARSNAAPPGSNGSGDTSGPGPATSTATAGDGSTPVPGAIYRDGSFTGGVADAQWGYVQVQAVIQAGKITQVKFLQYPSDRYRSVLINQYADPQLSSEAIQAQSAQVDIVSGATDSSYAFMQSLADALSQAHV
jgi:uncharacterized protein with FMN-binding domain